MPSFQKLSKSSGKMQHTNREKKNHCLFQHKIYRVSSKTKGPGKIKLNKKATVPIHLRTQAVADDSSLHKLTEKLNEFMDEKPILHY